MTFWFIEKYVIHLYVRLFNTLVVEIINNFLII